MNPTRYFAASSWILLGSVWVALLAMGSTSEAIGGMAILTAIAVAVAFLTYK